MATFSDVVKNIFWVLALLLIAPPLIKNIKQQYSDFFEHKTKVGVIPIKGALHSSGSTIKALKTFFEDSSIKAVILKVDSPGGLAGTSQTIYNEIVHYKKQYPNKYVVSFIENMAGSGGYYIASAANYIISSPGAFVGSIGSYIQHPLFKDFIEYHKIKYEVIKSGAYKTAGNPLLELTPPQKELLQSISNDVYHQFTRDVARQRPHLAADINVWADGKIFTGDQALSHKLIDAVGSPATVEQVLKDKAHIEGKIEWVKPPKRTSILGSLFGQDSDDDQSSFMSSFVNSLCGAVEQRYTTQVMY